MKTIEIKLYKFKELSEEAKQVAFNSYIEKNKEFQQQLNSDLFYEDIQYHISEIEPLFNKQECCYSLSYSQGDGLCFSFELDIYEYLNKYFKHLKPSVKDAIYNYGCFYSETNKGNYCYSSKSNVEFYMVDNKNHCSNLNSLFEKVEEHIQKNYLSVCSKLENIGYSNIYEWQYNEEYVLEEIYSSEDFEPIFLIDGSIY